MRGRAGQPLSWKPSGKGTHGEDLEQVCSLGCTQQRARGLGREPCGEADCLALQGTGGTGVTPELSSAPQASAG